MERKKASDYPQELLDLFHEYQHGDINRRDFLDRAKKFAVGGLTAAAIFETLRPNYAWAEQVKKDDPRIKVSYETVAVARGQRIDQGLLRAAGERRGQAARRARHPREPRAEPVHRGRRAAICRRELHRLRAGRPDLGRRVSRQRRRGRREVPVGERPEDDRRLRRLGEMAEGAAGKQRQARRRRLLLRRRHREPAGRAARQRSQRRRAVLRPSAERRGCGEDHGAADAAVRRRVHRHGRRTPASRRSRPRSRPTTRRTRSSNTRARSTASTTTRRRATTKRRPSSRGSGRSSSSTRTCADSPEPLITKTRSTQRTLDSTSSSCCFVAFVTS